MNPNYPTPKTTFFNNTELYTRWVKTIVCDRCKRYVKKIEILIIFFYFLVKEIHIQCKLVSHYLFILYIWFCLGLPAGETIPGPRLVGHFAVWGRWLVPSMAFWSTWGAHGSLVPSWQWHGSIFLSNSCQPVLFSNYILWSGIRGEISDHKIWCPPLTTLLFIS